jgi:hypothetical protein
MNKFIKVFSILSLFLFSAVALGQTVRHARLVELLALNDLTTNHIAELNSLAKVMKRSNNTDQSIPFLAVETDQESKRSVEINEEGLTGIQMKELASRIRTMTNMNREKCIALRGTWKKMSGEDIQCWHVPPRETNY